MMGRAMVLAAGFAMLAAPALMAQEEQGDDAQMERPRAEMRQRMAEHGHMQRAMGLDRMVGRLMDRQHELSLTDDQMSSLRELRDEAQATLSPIRAQMKEIHEGVSSGSMEREDAHNAMQGVHEQLMNSMQGFHGRLEEILEPEQRAALRQGRMEGARRGAMRQRGRMQRQRGQMEERHKRMQERKEAAEAAPTVEG